jgi:hypothetical protein
MSILSYIIIKNDKSNIRITLTNNLNNKPKSWFLSSFLILSVHKFSSFEMMVCFHQNIAKSKKKSSSHFRFLKLKFMLDHNNVENYMPPLMTLSWQQKPLWCTRRNKSTVFIENLFFTNLKSKGGWCKNL